ncbi:hypothetical protein [Fictibacillus sp. NRS-1165]|uniref:hypothetical protein n=1 Tax=Fictibacillus sp. NRS-1165 TaxID=3144463 RepID=UPI003D1CC0F4
MIKKSVLKWIEVSCKKNAPYWKGKKERATYVLYDQVVLEITIEAVKSRLSDVKEVLKLRALPRVISG